MPKPAKSLFVVTNEDNTEFFAATTREAAEEAAPGRPVMEVNMDLVNQWIAFP